LHSGQNPSKKDITMKTKYPNLNLNKPKRVCHSYTQTINATPDDVFPLLCPVREIDWAPGWQPDWVRSNSGVAEPGCIFQTPSGKDTVTEPAIWVVTEHHPEIHRVEMLKIIPGHTVMKLKARLEDNEQGGTWATIAYEYTAIGPQGEQFVETFTEDAYRAFMLGWETAMNHYLATGQKMAA
jgi:hypothetical protein